MAATKKTIATDGGKAPKKEAKPRSTSAKTKIKPIKVKVYKTVKKIEKEEKKEPVIEKEKLETFKAPWPPSLPERPETVEKVKTGSEKAPVTMRSLGIYKKIALSFIFLTLALLAVIFYFSFAKVFITITPSKERISNNVIADIYDAGKNAQAPDNSVAGAVRSFEVSDTKTFQSSGRDVIGGEAVGTATIYNHYNKNQPLVASTRLLTPDNKLFRTKETVDVPAGGSVEVEIYADNPAADLEVAPTRFTIPGLWAGLQDKIYGESKQTIRYEAQEKKFITEGDVDAGVADLKEDLLAKAKDQADSMFSDYNKVIYTIDNNSITTDVGGKVKDEKDEFPITMKASVVLVAFKDDRISEMCKNKLLESVPEGKQFADFNKDEIAYTLNDSHVDQGTATVNAACEGTVTMSDDSDVVDKGKLLGLTKEQVNDYLSSLPEISDFQVKFSPSFISKVPDLVDRIVININR